MKAEQARTNTAIYVNLKVQNPDGKEMFFKIKRTTQLRKLMASYCDRSNLSRDVACFTYEGSNVENTHTAKDLEMADGGTILFTIFQEVEEEVVEEVVYTEVVYEEVSVPKISFALPEHEDSINMLQAYEQEPAYREKVDSPLESPRDMFTPRDVPFTPRDVEQMTPTQVDDLERMLLNPGKEDGSGADTKKARINSLRDDSSIDGVYDPYQESDGGNSPWGTPTSAQRKIELSLNTEANARSVAQHRMDEEAIRTAAFQYDLERDALAQHEAVLYNSL